MTSWAEYVTRRTPPRNVARIRPGSTPRFEIWHQITGGGDPAGVQPWIDARWAEYEEERNLEPGKSATFAHQEPFDRWLTEYARRHGVEIVEHAPDARQAEMVI